MLLAFLLLAFSPTPLTPDVLRGFDHFYNVEYEEALAVFRKAGAADTNDPQRHNHIAQAILYSAMLKAGALESELISGTNPFLRREKMNPTAAEQAAFDDAMKAAFAKAEAQLQRNPKNAAANYSLAVSYGLRANYSYLVRKAWYESLKDSTAARKYAQLALDADPSFVDAKIILGLHDYIVGSLSWTYKMLGFLAGIRGDRDGGIRTLEQVAATGINNRSDAKVLLAAIYRREKRSMQAVPLLENLIAAYPRNYLFRLELAQMLGDLGEREKSIATVDAVADLQRKQAPGFTKLQGEKIAFIKGNLLFWFDEYDKAVVELQSAVKARDRLDLNTGLLACLRLGQTLDLLNRHAEAVKAYEAGIALAPDSEFARECQRYSNRQYKRNRIV
jgi:tetratricopeptide (TPR) repeat protein